MPQVDPKFTFWFGVWTNVLMLVAGYGIEHAPPFVAQYAPSVQWFAALCAQTNSVILTALVGISSTKPGPLINAPVVSPTTIVKILLVAFALALFLPVAPGHAQVKLGPVAQKIANDLAGQATDKSASAVSNIAAVLAKPFKDIADFIGADATSAISLSTVIPALQDGHGQQCWMAMKSFGDVIQAHPVPITFHVINDYETLRLLGIATNNLCSNVHCTQVFADATAMAQAASPIPLAIPSLHDLCTKVPQIAVVAPVPVPAASPSATPAVEPK